MSIPSLEREILAFNEGDQLLRGEVAELICHLGDLGFDVRYAEDGSPDTAFYWLPCLECADESNPAPRFCSKERVAIWTDGQAEFPPYFGSLVEAVTACLADYVTLRGESLKRRNRQIRDLRRALRK